METGTADLPIGIPLDAAAVIRRHGLERSLRKAYDILLDVYGHNVDTRLEVDFTTEGSPASEGVHFVVSVGGEFDEVIGKYHRFCDLLDKSVPLDHSWRLGVLFFPE